MRIINCNVASLKGRFTSLEKVIHDLKPSLFSLQETHLNKQGQIEIKNSKDFQVFEHTRKGKGGGGLALGARKDLSPVGVNQGKGETETLTVKVSTGGLEIRVTNGYGPQNYADNDVKTEFWNYMENEVKASDQSGAGCVILMDANSWLGKDILPDDPNNQNENGKLFQGFMERNKNLTLLNAHNLCKGSITRERKVKDRTEISILDFVVVCEQVLPFFKAMKMDKEK